jgi:hypothetical protein
VGIYFSVPEEKAEKKAKEGGFFAVIDGIDFACIYMEVLE